MNNYRIIIRKYSNEDPIDITKNLTSWEVTAGSRVSITSNDKDYSDVVIPESFYSSFQLSLYEDSAISKLFNNNADFDYVDFKFGNKWLRFRRPVIFFFGRNTYVGFENYIELDRLGNKIGE